VRCSLRVKRLPRPLGKNAKTVPKPSVLRREEKKRRIEEAVRQGKRRGRAAASPYLFTGLLACSECGGSITIVSGRCRKREDSRYGCSIHAQRGDSQCKNNLLISRRALEDQLLSGLQERVLHPAVTEYALKRFEEELTKALHARSQKDEDLRRQATELERGIANLLCGLSDGYSPSITAEIARLEKRQGEMQERLRASDPAFFKLQMRDTRRFVESRLEDLSALWNGEARIAREEIAKHMRKITLKPVFRTVCGDRYVGLARSNGKRGCYGGAGGRNRM
jgi:Recombinase zinc beta ribbon domain